MARLLDAQPYPYKIIPIMKKLLLLLMVGGLFSAATAQSTNPALVTVNGEGKIKAVPDQVGISVSVESKGAKAAEVKKDNDAKVDAVLKYLKKSGIADTDYKTTRVYLDDQYDYEKKKHNYVATQTIRLTLKDLNKYDVLMEGLVDSGVNSIGSIAFESSKAETLKTEARKKAVEDARKKALEFTAPLGQKIGPAYSITDNSPIDYPRPAYEMRVMGMADKALAGTDTLAAGEIEITANVSVGFYLLNKSTENIFGE